MRLTKWIVRHMHICLRDSIFERMLKRWKGRKAMHIKNWRKCLKNCWLIWNDHRLTIQMAAEMGLSIKKLFGKFWKLVLKWQSVPGCVTPVSYTHLDVYKRQTLYNWLYFCYYSNLLTSKYLIFFFSSFCLIWYQIMHFIKFLI